MKKNKNSKAKQSVIEKDKTIRDALNSREAAEKLEEYDAIVNLQAHVKEQKEAFASHRFNTQSWLAGLEDVKAVPVGVDDSVLASIVQLSLIAMPAR